MHDTRFKIQAVGARFLTSFGTSYAISRRTRKTAKVILRENEIATPSGLAMTINKGLESLNISYL